MYDHKEILTKWLRVLFYAQIAGIVLTVINMVTYLDNITAWISKAIAVACIWSLFQIQEANPRYRSAAIAKAAVLVCGLLTTPVNSSAVGLSSILALVGGIASWIASYQEYHAHGELVAEADEKLAKKWNGLFLKEVLVSLGISAFSVVGTIAMVGAGILSSNITTVVLTVFNGCLLVIEGLYLLYMKQTLALLEA